MTPDLTTPVPVLMYHQIAQPPETASRLAVSPGAWAAQLAHLHDGGYTTVTAAELSASLRQPGRLPERTVVLTFDDGFEDFHGRALPLLNRYGFTATVFVTTGWVQDAGPLPAGRRPGRMLSWSQICEAAAAGIEVAAHSRLHPQLDQLPPGLLREELYTSKAQLEDRIGCSVTGLAYPFGYSSRRVRAVVREVGYRQAAAVANAVAESACDPFGVPRLTIRRSTSLAAFARVANQQRVRLHYAPAHALTTGYAVVRRTRSGLRTLRNDVSSSATMVGGFR